MKFSTKPVVGLVVGATLLAGAPTVLATDKGDRQGRSSTQDDGSRGRDLNVVGLTQDSRLITFKDDRPRDARDFGKVQLTGDKHLVGIDYRPASGNNGTRGVLYGLGNAGGVYTIATDGSAKATKVSQLSVALRGTSFGVDFNPAVDRLRIISDTGHNLRHNVDAPTGGTLVDTELSYPPVPPATMTPATGVTGVTGVAYTNNDADAMTGTTLFDIDSAMDQTAIQSPANSGLLAPTGKLRVDTRPEVGSDIYSTIRNGTTVDLRGLASLTVGGESRFY